MSFRSVVIHGARALLQLGLLGLALVFTVATQPAVPRVRGEVQLRDAVGPRGLDGAVPPCTVLLVDGQRTERFTPATLVTDREGRAAWARKNNGYVLVVGHRPAGGLALSRPGPDGDIDAEYAWKVVVLAEGDQVAYVDLYLVNAGYAPPVQVVDDTVRLPAQPFRRWVVFAFAEGHYLVEPVPAGEADVALTLPDGFAGEVFAVWGDFRTERGATTPARVGVTPP